MLSSEKRERKKSGRSSIIRWKKTEQESNKKQPDTFKKEKKNNSKKIFCMQAFREDNHETIERDNEAINFPDSQKKICLYISQYSHNLR